MAHLGTQGISWALSGIDTALWDIVGRVAGQPLHRLWGGAWRDRSAFYADLVPGRAGGDGRGRAWPAVERGFRTLYLKVGFAPDIDEARVRAVRAAVGDGPRIRIDANAAWSPALALRMLQRLGGHGIEYAEQPLPAGDPAELARLRARSPGADPGARVEPHARGHARRDPLRRRRRAAARPALRRRHRGRPHGRAGRRGRGAAGRDAHVRRDRRRHGADAPAARGAPQLRARQPDLLPEPDRRRHPRRPARVRRPVPRGADGARPRRRARPRARRALGGLLRERGRRAARRRSSATATTTATTSSGRTSKSRERRLGQHLAAVDDHVWPVT